MKTEDIIKKIEENPKSLIQLQEEDKLVRLINKGLILGKNIDELANQIIIETSNLNVTEITSLIIKIQEAINLNSTNQLSKDDLMHAEKIIINQFNKNPNVKIIELLKDVKVALSINSHDDEIDEIIKLTRAKHLVDFESLGIDPRFKPRRKDFYVVEEKKGVFLTLAPNNSSPSGYVIGFAKNKLFFLGYKDGIAKQDYTRNNYFVKLLYGQLPGGKIITKLNDKGVLCKGVPLEEIPDSLAEDIKKKFLKEDEGITIGFSLSGENIRRINGKIELETISYSELLDDLQSRIAIVGSPGCGKTVITNIMQKQAMLNPNYLKGGTVTIAKDVPHLTNVGNNFKSFGEHVPKWDEEESSNEFIEKVKLDKLDGHKKIIISSESLIPNINKLSKETIIALVDNSDCSNQVKNALKKHIEESEDVVNILKKAEKGDLLGDEYLGSQDNALKRLINSIIPARYDQVDKLNLNEVLSSNKHVAFFIKGTNGDAFASMILWELYSLQKSKEIINPSLDGRLLVIDECQKFVRDKAFKDIFQRTVLDGRNFGICMFTIFQDKKEAEKNMGYPDFVTYTTFLENGKRMINVREKTALIPAIAPEVN